MFHVSFCRYFEYLHSFLLNFFSYNQYLSFYKRKTCFLQLFDFFSHTFFSSLKSQTYAFLFWWPFETFIKRNADYNFFSGKFYFYWIILTTRVYEGEVLYNTQEKSQTIKYLINCCVLTWFILFWIKKRDYYYNLLKLTY